MQFGFRQTCSRQMSLPVSMIHNFEGWVLARLVSAQTALRVAALKASMFGAYSAASQSFGEWVVSERRHFCDIEELELVMCEYAESLFTASELRENRQKFINTVFGIEFMVPSFKEQLLCARQAISSWDRVVPASSPPPVSYAVLSAVVCWLLDTGQSGVGLAL
jgi:hypothetical protein